MNAQEAEKALKASRAIVCSMPTQQVAQPEFSASGFREAMRRDKKADTLAALMDALSAHGLMGLIKPGENRYVDEWRESRRGPHHA